MLHTNNRLHGDGKVNTGVTTKNKIMQQNNKRRMKKIIFTGILEWHLSLFSLQHTFSPCNRCRCTSQVDQAEEQDGSGFLSFSCSNKLKTNEGCVIDLNSKINRIFLSPCMNQSKDL